MSKYTKIFPCHASAIVTDCIVMTPDDLSVQMPRAYYHSQNCAWDTGAEITIICTELAKALGVTEIGRGEVEGIGGNHESWVAEVHLGLPSGETFENLKVFVDDIPDYDLLIGMDVMREMDVAITNTNGKTKFTYERPSCHDIDFAK